MNIFATLPPLTATNVGIAGLFAITLVVGFILGRQSVLRSK